MKLFAIFIFLICSQALASGGFVVGNGAEGIQIQDKIYLRDLFDIGLQRQEIQIGEIAPIYRERIHDLELGTEFPYLHLAAKLTHLDRVSPGFGRMLFTAIKKYTWEYVPFSLPKVQDFTNHCLAPSTSEEFRLQIAIRHKEIVRIDRRAFLQMPPAHQVALIIHEVIFSLVIPQTVYNQLCFHGATLTRGIVGLLFHRGFLAMGPQEFERRIFPHLSIPLIHELPLNLDYFTYEFKTILLETPYWGGRLQKYVSSLRRNEEAKKICQTARNLWFERDPEVKIRLTTNPFVNGFFSTLNSNFGPQYYLALVFVPNFEQEISVKDGQESCIAKVEEFFQL